MSSIDEEEEEELQAAIRMSLEERGDAPPVTEEAPDMLAMWWADGPHSSATEPPTPLGAAVVADAPAMLGAGSEAIHPLPIEEGCSAAEGGGDTFPEPRASAAADGTEDAPSSWCRYVDEDGRTWFWNSRTEEFFYEDQDPPGSWCRYVDDRGLWWWSHHESGRAFYEPL